MVKTGFSFLDRAIGEISADDLVMLQGECIQTEQFTISLMQSILNHNDGYIILFNTRDFREFTLTVFDNFAADEDISLISSRLSNDRILKRNLTVTESAEVFQNRLKGWLKSEKYKHLQNKKLLAVFASLPKRLVTNEADTVVKFKEMAKALKTPIFYLQEFKCIDYEVADKIIKLTALNNYLDPIEINIKKSQSAQKIIEANKDSLKYSKRLKDCQGLWFYEE